MYRKKIIQLIIRTTTLSIFLILGGCGRNQEVEFSRLSDAFIHWYFKTHPVIATRIGYHEYDGEYGSYTEDSVREKISDLKRFNIEMTQIDPHSLSQAKKIDYYILSNTINKLIFHENDIREIEWNPMLVPGLISNGLNYLINREFAPMEERVHYLESRLSGIPELVTVLQSNLLSSPEVHREIAEIQITNLLKFLKDLPLQIYTDNSTFDRIDDLIRKASASLSQYKTWLSDGPLKEHIRDFRLGEINYRKEYNFTINEDILPEDLLALAKEGIISTQNKMFSLAFPIYLQDNDEPVWVSRDDTLNVIQQVLNKIANDHTDSEDLIETARKSIRKLTQFIEQKEIITLDHNYPLDIQIMPEFMRGFSFVSLDTPGPMEKSFKTYYNISPIPDDWNSDQIKSFLREYNNYSIQILNIHEVLPGHFVQSYYSSKNPSWIRAVFSSGTMIEGWAHYCEGMMVDEGYGDSDPRMKIVQLKWALKGMIDVIIDQETHMRAMTREAAVNYMVREGFQELSEAERKWRRVQLTYCELSTNFAGVVKIQDLRRVMEEIRGDKFNLKSFHERVLSAGSAPIKFISDILLGQ